MNNGELLKQVQTFLQQQNADAQLIECFNLFVNDYFDLQQSFNETFVDKEKPAAT